MFGIDDAIMGAIIGSMGTVAGSAIGKNAATGSDLNPRQHRELWTERLRFNQQSRRQRNDLADYEQRRSNYRQGLVRRFNRYQSMYDAGTSRNIRRQDFNQTLGMNEQLYHQQYGMKARSFTQNQLFNQSQFTQNQYLEGMRLNTETAGRAGQRGIAQRQELQAMFPEASPWDLMGTSQSASAGQAVLPGYPSAQSANNAAGPSPSQQLRASEMASASKMAAMLMPTPAVQAAQAGAHAQMYSSTVHAMSGLAQALIGAQAPLKQAGIAGSKASSEIDLNKKRGSLAATQAGTEVGKQEIQDYEIPIKKAEARHAGKYYKGRADYESQRTNLGYGQLGVSGLGVIQANRMLNKLGRSLFGQSDQLTKKLSGARRVHSGTSKRDTSPPRYWRDDNAIPRSSNTDLVPPGTGLIW